MVLAFYARAQNAHVGQIKRPREIDNDKTRAYSFALLNVTALSNFFSFKECRFSDQFRGVFGKKVSNWGWGISIRETIVLPAFNPFGRNSKPLQKYYSSTDLKI